MRLLLLVLVMTSVVGINGCAKGEREQAQPTVSPPATKADVRTQKASALLDHYTDQALFEGVWKREGLSPKDRSLVTLSAVITRGDESELAFHLGKALDNGVSPAELSELIVHLAFYAGWGSATRASHVLERVYVERKLKDAKLPALNPKLLVVNAEEDAPRAERVAKGIGEVSPGLAKYTNEVLFGEIWRRPGLALRDRSLVAVSSLIASGQSEQLVYHLNRAMDNGLTQEQVSEVLTQLAFYTGWPKVFSAVPVVKQILSARKAS